MPFWLAVLSLVSSPLRPSRDFLTNLLASGGGREQFVEGIDNTIHVFIPDTSAAKTSTPGRRGSVVRPAMAAGGRRVGWHPCWRARSPLVPTVRRLLFCDELATSDLPFVRVRRQLFSPAFSPWRIPDGQARRQQRSVRFRPG